MEENIVREIERIVKENINGKTVNVKGREFLFENGRPTEIEEKEYLIHQEVELTDLKSFCEIIKNEIGKIDTTLFVQVVNPTLVKAFTTLDSKNRRQMPYVCVCQPPRCNIGSFQSYEEFVIGLRANFIPTDDTANIIKMIANMVNCEDQMLTDDGVSQTVRTRKGTQLGEAEVKSIVALAPFRTFTDVAQPVSEFLFRITDNGKRFGLFEADGGNWKLGAKQVIAEYIKEQFKDTDKVKVLF